MELVTPVRSRRAPAGLPCRACTPRTSRCTWSAWPSARSAAASVAASAALRPPVAGAVPGRVRLAARREGERTDQHESEGRSHAAILVAAYHRVAVRSDMLTAITRQVSPAIARCELTHLEREPIDVARAAAQHEAYERCLAALGCRVVEPAGRARPARLGVRRGHGRRRRRAGRDDAARRGVAASRDGLGRPRPGAVPAARRRSRRRARSTAATCSASAGASWSGARAAATRQGIAQLRRCSRRTATPSRRSPSPAACT